MNEASKGPTGFCDRLRTLRESRRLSQATLAHHLGTTGSMVSLWEKGSNYPAFWNLVEITRFFGVDMDWLVGMPYVRNEMQNRMKVREQLAQTV
jgi:transcriptional regulator with XRE-family HTH domain